MSTSMEPRPPVRVRIERCQIRAISGPREITGLDCYELVMVRAGCFRYRDHRGRILVDPTRCIFGAPGANGESSHPVPGGDLTLTLELSAQVLAAVGGGSVEIPLSASVTPNINLAQHRLATIRIDDDPLETEEMAIGILAAMLTQHDPGRVAAGRPTTRRRRRQLAEDARTLLAADPSGTFSLLALANQLDCSPHHLSRVFAAQTGRTISSHRASLRLNLALERLAETTDRPNLARLATECGFADQAHLSREIRRNFATTPRDLHRSLTSRRSRADA